MWRKPKIWLGFIISAIALFLAFRGIEWPQLGAALAQANYVYLLPSAGLLLIAMLIRAERWRWLYGERRVRVSFARAFSPLAIGYLITNTFPLRLGEVARTIFIARNGAVTMAHTASTIVVEHTLDVLTVLGILVALLAGGSVPLPDWAAQGAAASAYAFGAALIVMLILVWQRARVECWTEQLLDRIPRLHTQTWLQRVIHILDGFAVLQPGKPLLMIVFWSITGWLASALTFHLALMAFIPQPPFSVSLFVTVTCTFSLLLPATPGGLGVLQYAIKLSLLVFGSISEPTALSIAIVFHVMEIVVMDVIGAVALWREAGSWASMKAQLRSVTSPAADTPSA
jgi:glycosyltransferase 2 family protein